MTANPGEQTMQKPGVSTARTDAVVPRWEWRIFEQSLPVASGLLDATAGEKGTARDETYLISLRSPHNVKVRDDRLELKRLERTHASGLERWRPVVQAAMPIAGELLHRLCKAWDVPLPKEVRRTYTLAELIRDVAVPSRVLHAVTLTKRRTRLTLDGCPGERVELWLGRQRWESLAFEHEDPDRVLAAVRQLNLGDRPNLNYPAALKRILGLHERSTRSSPAVG